MSKSRSQVVFKFRRPAGSLKKQPSRAMTEALERLSESDETATSRSLRRR
ncbi:MAG TPA: hypothetical protein VD837_07815 [Terriglobales bacterium]|nr:hypothetical protein [Terriglobales bacterium]